VNQIDIIFCWIRQQISKYYKFWFSSDFNFLENYMYSRLYIATLNIENYSLLIWCCCVQVWSIRTNAVQVCRRVWEPLQTVLFNQTTVTSTRYWYVHGVIKFSQKNLSKLLVHCTCSKIFLILSSCVVMIVVTVDVLIIVYSSYLLVIFSCYYGVLI